VPPLLYVCGLVAYDGTEFHGFQIQQGVPTIQGTLEAVLQRLTGTPVRVHGAGRTDTGVHARGQVIAAQVPWRHSVADLQRAWNAHLPRSIAVRKVQQAPDGFHPRYSAVARTYRYSVIEAADPSPAAPRHSPLTDRFAWYVTGPLNLVAMQAAAAQLLGEQDFATFGQPPVGENTVRTVDVATWQVVESNLPPLGDDVGRTLIFTIRANAFLYQMVRNLVGALVAVGQGRWTVAQFEAALRACLRSQAAPPAPPQGLVLERVDFPAGLGLQWE
jgi:tRNA pseudouridine38-40 synthase